jgi:hypothetical protein
MKENTLHAVIQSMAENFASSLVGAVRSASIDDILGAPPAARGESSPSVAERVPARRNGRLRRRSLGDIDVLAQRIQTLLGSNKNGLRAEEIRLKLGIDRREIPRALAEGTRKGLFSKKGQKRATTYYRVGLGGAAKSARSAARSATSASRRSAGKKSARSVRSGKSRQRSKKK